MASRSTTSEYQPAPPITRLRTINAGKVRAAMAIKTTASSAALKSNVCTAPATNGSRDTGAVVGTPATSVTAQKIIRPGY